jgi:hypothetical protein
MWKKLASSRDTMPLKYVYIIHSEKLEILI